MTRFHAPSVSCKKVSAHSITALPFLAQNVALALMICEVMQLVRSANSRNLSQGSGNAPTFRPVRDASDTEPIRTAGFGETTYRGTAMKGRPAIAAPATQRRRGFAYTTGVSHSFRRELRFPMRLRIPIAVNT